MKRIFSYTITAQDSDQRIYDFLCHHGYSRHIRTWLKQHPGSVRLNDKEALFYFPAKKTFKKHANSPTLGCLEYRQE